MSEFMKFIFSNWGTIVNGLILVLTGLIGIFLIIPGPEPENTLQKLLDFLTKISKK